MPRRRPIRPAANEPRRVVAYRRVSTAEQGVSGAGLDAQAASIRAEAIRRGWTIVADFADVSSGATDIQRRAGGAAALATLKGGEADILMVAKLDRLSRSTEDGLRTIRLGFAAGWGVVALDFDIDTTTPEGELHATIGLGFATFERKRIGQRTREGMAAKRAQAEAQGSTWKVGRPRELDPVIRDRILREHEAGRGLTAIAQGLERDGVPTARGGKWWPSTIQAVVEG